MGVTAPRSDETIRQRRERERRACVRAEDGDNKLSFSGDMSMALSGSDYLQDCSKM